MVELSSYEPQQIIFEEQIEIVEALFKDFKNKEAAEAILSL